MGSFTALFLPGGLGRRCLLCTSAQIGDVPPASPVATRSPVFLRTIRIYGFCVGLEIQIYIYILFRYKYYLHLCLFAFVLKSFPFRFQIYHHSFAFRQAGPTGFLVPLSLRFGGWRGGLGRSRSGCPTWLRCIRPWCPSKGNHRFKNEHFDPLCQSIHWQGDADDWHPGREEQKLHQICPFWHLSWFYLFSCIVNILLGFVSIPSISHSEFPTDSNPPVIQLRVWMLANFPGRWLGPQIGVGWQK